MIIGKHMKKTGLLIALSVISLLANAQGIYKKTASMDFKTAYQKVYSALEDERFYVIHEINIGENLAGFKDKWKDYNLNKVENQQVMIICNGWYANQVGNADPEMLALCPLHITLTEKEGRSTVLFVRPSAVAKGSKAEAIASEIEHKVIKAIEDATCATQTC